YPGDLQPLALERTLLDLGARVVGPVAEIGRPAIDRHRVDSRWRAAAAQLRLEVAGEASGRLHHQGPEIFFEETSRSSSVGLLYPAGSVTDRLPLCRCYGLLAAVGDDLGFRARGQFGAGTLEG